MSMIKTMYRAKHENPERGRFKDMRKIMLISLAALSLFLAANDCNAQLAAFDIPMGGGWVKAKISDDGRIMAVANAGE